MYQPTLQTSLLIRERFDNQFQVIPGTIAIGLERFIPVFSDVNALTVKVALTGNQSVDDSVPDILDIGSAMLFGHATSRLQSSWDRYRMRSGALLSEAQLKLPIICQI